MKKLSALSDHMRPCWVDLLVIVLVGLGLRLLFLGSKSFWLDEANGLRVALNGQQSLWAGQSEGYHPPLYYWLLEWWAQFGRSEFHLRLLSVIPAVMSIPVLYLLAQDWLGKDAAMSAAALAAVSPLLVWYAQESRPYALLALLGLLILYAVGKLFERPAVGWWLLSVGGMTTALYLHYFAVLLVPLQIIVFISFLVSKRLTWPATLSWLVGLGMAFLAWWPWLRTPTFARFLGIAFDDRSYLHDLFVIRLGLPLDVRTVVLALGVMGLFVVVGVGYFFSASPWTLSIPNRLHALPEQRWAKVVAGALFLLLLVVSVVPRGYSLKRQVVVLWPYVLLLFAWFWPWRAQARGWLIPVLLLSLAVSLVNVIAVPKPQWREANAAVLYYQQDHDVVLLEPAYMRVPFEYYNEGRTKSVGLPFGADPDRLQALLDENARVWLIVHQADNDPQQRNATWLDGHATLAGTMDFYRLHVRLYESYSAQ